VTSPGGRSGTGALARQLVDPGKAVVKASSRRLFGAAMVLAITAAVAAVAKAREAIEKLYEREEKYARPQ
jgi:hypothetical protein